MSNSKNNYKKRRENGQCADCKIPSIRFRCDACREKANAYLREHRFEKSMQRERRLAELEVQLEKEVRQLEVLVLGWHK